MRKRIYPLYLLSLVSIMLPALIAKEQNIPLNAATLPSSIDVTNLTSTQVNDYYEGVQGLANVALQAKLNSIIKGHTSFDYQTTKTIMQITDRNWDLSPLTSAQLQNYKYSGSTADPYLKLLYGSAYNDNLAQATKWSDNHVTIWNKEHTWSKTLGSFGEEAPAGTDLHHLIGADQALNGYHSNYDFGEPTSDIKSRNDEKGNATTAQNGKYQGVTVFLPPEEDRGDVARALFYMATRYYTHTSVGEPALQIIEGSRGGTHASSNTTPGQIGFLSFLLKWHKEDPVSAYEIQRNNLIANNYQKNRNPYIDHPEWANMVFDQTYSGAGASLKENNACTISSCNPYSVNEGVDLLSIELETEHVNKEYFVGEHLNFKNLSVNGVFADGKVLPLDDYRVNIIGQQGLTLNQLGSSQVEVSYTEGGITKTATYDIKVGSVRSFTLSDAKRIHVIGEDFNDQNVTGLVTFELDGLSRTRAILNGQLQISVPNILQVGEQIVTVKYLDYQASYTIKITNEGSRVSQVTRPNELFISEYIEGSLYNKALEIYNGSGTQISLDEYSLTLINQNFNESNFNLEGIIEPNSTYVIASNKATNSELLTRTDLLTNSSVLNFNGDDALLLKKNQVTIDYVGVPNESYGVDKTLVRKPSVNKGSLIYDPSEWTLHPIDTFTNLGIHLGDFVNSDLTPLNQAQSYARYFLTITHPYCLTSDVGNIPWLTLKEEYLFLPSLTREMIAMSNDSVIAELRARYLIIINLNSNFANDNFILNQAGQPLTRNKLPSNDLNPLILYLTVAALLVACSVLIISHKTIKQKH